MTRINWAAITWSKENQQESRLPPRPRDYWIEIDEDGLPTGHACSAYYGVNDKPMEGTWILVREVKDEI